MAAITPKLQIAAPFTPVPGPRLLVKRGPGRKARLSALAHGAAQVASRLGASSLHVTFCTEEEWTLLGAAGFLRRTGEQFHWTNAGYDSFEHFLAALASRKRKAIRKERREAIANGIDVRVLEGTEIREADWDRFFKFYVNTGLRKWGQPYLNREFFQLLGARMADDVLLVLARDDGRVVAGALHFKGAHTLFGRYWGAATFYPALHFELCYYQAIEYAIRHRLHRVEAGAQGGTSSPADTCRRGRSRLTGSPTNACGPRWPTTSRRSAGTWTPASPSWSVAGHSARRRTAATDMPGAGGRATSAGATLSASLVCRQDFV